MYKAHTKKHSAHKAGPIESAWNTMDNNRSTQRMHWEKFASWTLPMLYPSSGGNSVENEVVYATGDNIGADAVNHLSNHIIDTLFTPWRPFFRIYMSDELQAQLQSEAGMDQVTLDTIFAEKEREAVNLNNDKSFRAEAPMVAKLLITTGNALMYYPKGTDAVQVYNPRDYVIKRDLSGNMVKLITRDTKALETFSKDIIEQIRTNVKSIRETHEQVTIFTQIAIGDDGKFKVTQEAEGISLDTGENFYTKNDLPWIPLVWNLKRGEDWGRGLVEEKAKTFHTLAVLTEAEAQIVANAAEIKFLVKPSSYIDIDEVVEAPSGSYHIGEEGDISVISINKHADLSQINLLIERYRKEIMSTFLMEESVRREAERVTAVEIRYMAQRLESKHGGIYSRLADDWQKPIAYRLLSSIEFDIGGSEDIIPRIITGMESLSRSTEMDNIAMVFNDLSTVNALPEEARTEISFGRLLRKASNNRGVDPMDFMKTEEEKQAEIDQAMALQAQAQDQDVSSQVATNAATTMMEQ